MGKAQDCADGAIAKFVEHELKAPYWPNWAGLVPGDSEKGWGASKADWRAQCGAIMDDFDACAGVTIARVQRDINKLRSETLAILSDYLVDRATLAQAQAALIAARQTLLAARANIRRLGQ